MAQSLESPDAILPVIQMYAQAGIMRWAGRSLESAVFWTNQVGLIIHMQKDIGCFRKPSTVHVVANSSLQEVRSGSCNAFHELILKCRRFGFACSAVVGK